MIDCRLCRSGTAVHKSADRLACICGGLYRRMRSHTDSSVRQLMRSRTLPAYRPIRIVSLANISIALIILIAVYVVPMFLLGSPV
jgi:hypothetical protein